MDLQVKSHPAVVFCKYIQHFAGACCVVVECTVQYAYVFDAVCVDVFKSCSDLFKALVTDGFLSSADTERTCVEASASGLQLYEWLVPFEEWAFLGIFERSEVGYSSYAVVVVCSAGVYMTKSWNGIVCAVLVATVVRFAINRTIVRAAGIRLLYVAKPCRKGLFSFASNDCRNEWVSSEEGFVVAKEFRSAADDFDIVQQLCGTC